MLSYIRRLKQLINYIYTDSSPFCVCSAYCDLFALLFFWKCRDAVEFTIWTPRD